MKEFSSLEIDVSMMSDMSTKSKKQGNSEDKKEIFFITTFHYLIWDDNLSYFTSNNSQVGIISEEYRENSDINKNYIYRIFNVKFNKKRDNYLYLLYNDGDLLNLELKELYFKDKKCFVFADLIIEDKNFLRLKNYLLQKIGNNNNITKDNYYLKVDNEQKLKFYKNYIDDVFNRNEGEKNKYYEYLAHDFISTIKKIRVYEIYFSTAANLFILSQNNKNIISFLDICSNFIYKKDDINKDFSMILNDYINDDIELSNILIKHDKFDKYDNYKKILDNFLLTYYTLYQKEILFNDKKIALKAKDILFKIINNRENLVDSTKMIYEYIDILFSLYDRSDFENTTLKVANVKNINSLNFDEFSKHYSKVTNYQKNNCKEYFIIYKDVITKLKDLYSNNLLFLEKILRAFKFDLSQPYNYDLKMKLTTCYYYAGMKAFNRGDLKNENLINFIELCDVYKSTKNDVFFINTNFIKQNNESLKNLKNINILQGLDILSEKGPSVIAKLNQSKIYKNFCYDLGKEYIELFASKIKHIKNLGIFFEILPNKFYNYDSVFALKKWVDENLVTFSENECKNFQQDANNFLEVLINNQDNLVDDFIANLIQTLNKYCKQLFLYFLTYNKFLNKRIITILIIYFISPKVEFHNYDIKSKENITYFADNFRKDDNNIIKIFLDEILNLSIKEDDIFNTLKTNQYFVFELLLKNKSQFIINRKGEYLDKTKKFCEEFLQKLKNLYILYLQINMFLVDAYEKKKLLHKIESLIYFLSEDKEKTESIVNESEIIYNKIEDNYKNAKELISNLAETSSYLDKFFNENKDKIKLKKEIDNFINELWSRTLDEIENNQSVQEKKNKYKKLIEKAKTIIIKDRFSNLFRNIYANFKKKIVDQVELLAETEKNYYSAIKLIKDNPEKIQKNYYFNYYYEIGYQNEENLKNEINWIIKNEKIIINDEQKNKLFASFKTLINKHNIINIINGILTLKELYEGNIKPNNEEEKYFRTLKEKLKLLNQKISSKDINIIINIVKQKFKEISFDENDKNYKNFILPFFNSFNINKTAFIYFKELKGDNSLLLKDFLLDSDERELNLYDIDQFNQVIDFLNNDILSITSAFTLVNTFISGILNPKKFGPYLIVVNNYYKFKNLFDKYLLKEYGVFSKVRDIMNDSFFEIKFLKDKKVYEITGEYTKILVVSIINKKEKEKITFKELDDLYERVFISISEDKKKDYVPKFIEYFKCMDTLRKYINILYNSHGYPEEIKIGFKISAANIQCFYRSGEYSPNKLIIFFRIITDKINKLLFTFLTTDPELRFFYGRQLYLLNQHLKEKETDKVKDLISCQTNGLIKEFNKDFNFYRDDSGNNNEEKIYLIMLNNIKKYIKEQIQYNKKEIKNIYLKNSIKESNDENNKFLSGFFFYPTNIEEYDILNIFNVLTKSNPMNSNLLFCNKNTPDQEIFTFVIKAIYCEIASLFLIFIPKYINNSQKIFLLKLLKINAEKISQMMKSCLIIMFNFSDSEFHSSIMSIKNIELMKLKSELKMEELKLDNYHIVSSNVCGLGKSTYIRSKKENKEMIYFPIGGELTNEDLNERIKTLIGERTNNRQKNYILHIDFTQTNNTEIVKDFLFKLLILKKIEIEDNVIYISPNIEIYIEISNDFYSYANSYKILNFDPKPIILNSIGPFIFENDDKKFKIVATMLHFYKNNRISNETPNFEKDCLKNANDMKKLILEYLDIKNPNYYQIKTFIRILAFEFEKFNECYGFSPNLLKQNMKADTAEEIRKLIIKYFINITKHFTSGPFEELIKIQDKTKLDLDPKNKNKELLKKLENKIEGITYKDIKPSLVVFNLDGGSVSILTTLSEDDREFKDLKKLYHSQNIERYKKDKKDISQLKNLSSMNTHDILSVLNNFLNLNISEDKIRDIVGNYVYTADNLIKVILIIMRIKAKVPAIMMGETGCGKTRLIEMAFKLINKNKNISLRKLNIHAGINDNDIIDFIEKTIDEVKQEDEALIYQEISKEENIVIDNKQISLIKERIYNREIWVFFDEINTCNSMGLLSEILCNNSYRGKSIPERFIFLAACNPYRTFTGIRKIDEILFHKKENKNMLVYSVNPLPHSLLNYVLYFGTLKDEDEKEYIKSMVKVSMLPYKEEFKNQQEYNELIKIQTECISIAQNFLKKEKDISIVSLREVNRYLIFFKFFEKFIQERNKNDPLFLNNEFRIIFEEKDEIANFYKDSSKFFLHKAAINLSLFICYYLRLPDKERRKQLEKKFSETNYFEGSFLKIPNLEMDYVINNFIVPVGIAKNRALKENLFCALYCIANKIPLIICGKPGRSKTLCVQILENSMRGKISSKSYLCRYFPELIIHKIQGALNTKSEDVLNIFQKAREEQKQSNIRKEEREKLHLVFMDELGLAELSINNPLKVTHYEFEKEDDEKVPFVGITNWALDASKMNRVIYIVIQDPDVNDLIQTAKEIVKSLDTGNQSYYGKYPDIFKNLAKAYHKFITDIEKKNNQIDKYFYGSRDFYSLIKNVISDIIKNKEKLENKSKEDEYNILFDICSKNIDRNFGGLENSSVEMKSNFIELFNHDISRFNIGVDYDLLGALKESLYDLDGRYLLLISDSSISENILKYMIEEINTQIMNKAKNQDGLNTKFRTKKVVTFLGSKFKSDEKSAYYCDEILNKIKYQMETENILILKDLEIVYPSLYQLFNRSFFNFQNIKFAYLGKSKSLSLVNDKFKVIVLVDKEHIPKEDPPFLNRFEKHFISFKNILNDELMNIADEIDLIIKDIFKSFSEIKKIQKKNIYSLNTEIKFINIEEIRGFVYIASKKGIHDKNEIINFIFHKIVPTFTEDMMLILQKSSFNAKYSSYYENILEIYKNNYSYNLDDFISKCESNISIIYTFSIISDFLLGKGDKKIVNKHFNQEIYESTTKEILISEINSYKNMEKTIINYMTEDNTNLCIIKFRESDLIKLKDVFNLVNEYIKKDSFSDIENTKKMFIILIYLSRTVENINKKEKIENDFSEINNNINKYSITFLDEKPQYFIDNLNNKENIFINILSDSPEKTLTNLIVENNLITKQINNALFYMDFSFHNITKIYKGNIQNLKNNIIEKNYDIKEEGINEEVKKTLLKNYKEILILFVVMNKELNQLIIKSVINLLKSGNDIYKRLYTDYITNKDSIDFIQEFKNFFEEEVKFSLVKILYLFDNNQILVSFLCNKDIIKYDIIYQKLINFTDNINARDVHFNNIDLNNKVNCKILYGIKIPFLQNTIQKIIFNFIKNEISNQYIQKEFILIKKIPQEKIDSEIQKYMNDMKDMNNKFKNELINYQMIYYILNSGKEELIKDLFNDCFIIFLMKSNIFNNDYDYLIELLDLIIQIRFKPRLKNDLEIDNYTKEYLEDKIYFSKSFFDLFKENNVLNINNNINEIIEEKDNTSYIQIFADVLLFIESYSKEIYYILNIFQILNEITGQNNIKKIRENISEKKIDINENDYQIQINTMCFYLIMESILIEIISFLEHKDFFEIKSYIKKMKINIMNLIKIEKTFSLFSKELFTFEQLIKIYDYYEKQEQKKAQEINKGEYELVIKLIIEGDQLLLNKKYDELDDNLNQINKSLKKIFDEYSNEYTELMISLALNRYKSNKIDKNRENLLKLLIPDNISLINKKLLEKSYSLISLVLGKSEPEVNIERKNSDEYKEKFLKFVRNKENKDFIFKKILNKDYPALNEVIIYFYENSCQKYFKKIIDKTTNNTKERIQNLCGKTSKIYLQEAINNIKIFEEKINDDQNCLNVLGKHYCLAYIKRYLEYYIKILKSEEEQYLEKKEEINKILFSGKEKIIKEIKYYTLKLCYKSDKKNENFDEFIRFLKEDINIGFNTYFKDINLFDDKIFFYSMIPYITRDNSSILDKIGSIILFNQNEEDTTDFQKYKKYYETLVEGIKNGENINNIEVPRKFKGRIADVIYTYIYFNLCKYILNNKINNYEEKKIKEKLISLLKFNERINDNDDEERIYLIFSDRFDKLNFIKLIFEDSFIEKVLPKLKIKLEPKYFPDIEILFYALRFVFNILFENCSNNFYFSLLTNRALETINNNMIPGKLANTNNIINNFEIIKKSFNKNRDYGAYLCSCGYHYSIDYCSFPLFEFKCPNCNEIIGGKNHILHRREGHMRIFFNEQYKDYYLNSPYADRSVPYILLNDLEQKVNKEKMKLFKGLNKESKNYFLERRTNVREMSYITFRILNYILHGFILYANLQNHLSDEYLKDNLIDSMTCFEIMKEDWKIIDKELKIKQIPNVQTFMNIIFDKLFILMKSQKYFEEEKKLYKFEKDVEKIVETELNNINLINSYIKDNEIMTDTEVSSDKLIILDEYINNEYKNLKYFRISKLPDFNDFSNQFNSLEENKDEYPIINYILEPDSNIKYLKYLPILNQVCNYMINHCSYKYTRDSAKTMKINDTERLFDDKTLDKFIKIYEKLRPFVEAYECHEFIDRKGDLYFNDLNNNKYYSNFCVDINEFNYGMVLTAIYLKMISWQNQFISVVLNSNNASDKNYSGLFENEIMIQDCNENDIIKFPDKEYIMNEIIIKNSYQKNYGVIIYNYQLIEEELASKILPSIKKFISNNETCLRYVTYQFEGFKGNKSNIITKFNDKYKPMDLSPKELAIIYNYKIKVHDNNILIKTLFSLQILIDVILENNYNKNESILKIISKEEKNENFEILKDLFYDENKNNNIKKNKEKKESKLFKVDRLINVFNIIELICWAKIKDNIIEDYNEKITESIKKKFDSFYKIENTRYIKKMKLATALRRFMSRYLTGKSSHSEFNKNNSLELYLSKEELWDEFEFTKSFEFNNELSELFSDENNNCLILVGHSMDLYNYLGGDETLLNKYFEKMEVNKDEQKKEIINNDLNSDMNEFIMNEENIENIDEDIDINNVQIKGKIDDNKEINEIILNEEDEEDEEDDINYDNFDKNKENLKDDKIVENYQNEKKNNIEEEQQDINVINKYDNDKKEIQNEEEDEEDEIDYNEFDKNKENLREDKIIENYQNEEKDNNNEIKIEDKEDNINNKEINLEKNKEEEEEEEDDINYDNFDKNKENLKDDKIIENYQNNENEEKYNDNMNIENNNINNNINEEKVNEEEDEEDDINYDNFDKNKENLKDDKIIENYQNNDVNEEEQDNEN